MDENALLLGIEALRADHNYYSAEVLRRKTSGDSSAMAAAGADAKERAAVLLLIGTWDVISNLLRGIKTRDKIFEVTPVCHMYRELLPAIEVIRQEAPGFAESFSKLNDEYEVWLKKKKKDAKYISAMCGGLLYAKFG